MPKISDNGNIKFLWSNASTTNANTGFMMPTSDSNLPDRWVLMAGVWVEIPKPPATWMNTTTNVMVGTKVTYTWGSVGA